MSNHAWKHEPFYWAPTKKFGRGWIAHKSAPSAPPAPDYAGAAQATAAGNLEAAKYATEANRVNQVTPWGSLTWTKSTAPGSFNQAGYDAAMANWQANQNSSGGYDNTWDDTPGHRGGYSGSYGGGYSGMPMPTRDQFTTGGGQEQWTQTQQLTPELQAALDSQIAVQKNQSTLAQTMQGQVQSTMSKPFTAPEYSQYASGVPGVNTNFGSFNYGGTGTANTGFGTFTPSTGGPNTQYASFDASGLPGVQTNSGAYTAGAGPTAVGNQYWMGGVNAVNQDAAGALGSVPGVGYFNPSQLQMAGGASGGHVSTDASSYVSGVPGIDYDSRVYTNGVQPVNYNAPVFDQQSLNKYVDSTYHASTRLLQDQWNQQNSNLDVQLRLQGLTPGTEAYNNAMQNALKSQDFTKAQLADTALTTGSQIANQDYASMLAGYKARNDAQAQDFSQRLQNYNANLAAQNQGFGQGMAKANFAQTGENMNATNAINAAGVNTQAAIANNNARLGAYSANLGAQAQAYAQALQKYQAGNAAQAQAFDQGRASFADYNSSQNQAFNQGLAGFGADNSAQQQAFGQAAGVYGMDQTAQDKSNAAQQQAYQQALSTYGANMDALKAGNEAQQQNFNQYLAQYGADQAATQAQNAAQAQAYQQAQNNYSTAYQAALNKYTMPLNMMNAVMSGNQVQSPQFGGYYTQGQTAGPDMLGAASSLGQWQSGVMAQQQAAASSQNGLLGSAAMAAAMYF